MTNQGGGWDVATTISPDEEHIQNAGFAPAEMFGQTDVAQSIASGQLVAVANRVPQVRTAMRNRDVDPSYALTRRLGGSRAPQPAMGSFWSGFEFQNAEQTQTIKP